jgi:hypothetical protein
MHPDSLMYIGVLPRHSICPYKRRCGATRARDLPNWQNLLAMDESMLSRNVARMCARGGSGWNIAKMIAVAIKSPSRTWVRLCYEKAIPLGKKRQAK